MEVEVGRCLLTVIAALSISCSDERPDPGGVPLPLRAGHYVFDIGAPALACNDIGVPQSGTSAQALGVATLSGSAWILRPASAADGNFQLQLGPGARDGSFLIVNGTMRGQMIDNHPRRDGIPPSGRRASFQTVPVLGNVATGGGIVIGSFGGQVIFNREGIISICPPGQVRFSLTGQH